MRARRVRRLLARGLWLLGTSLPVGIALVVWTAVTLTLTPYEIGRLAAVAAARAVRAYADGHRRRARAWFGLRIDRPYRRPEVADWREVVDDPATWRDLVFALATAPVGFATGLLPWCLLGNAVFGLVAAPLVWAISGSHSPFWPISIPIGALTAVLLVVLDSRLLVPMRWLDAALLGPGRGELARRVEQARSTRVDAVDDAAAELRRIERDLHDGAQARLISLGMTLGLAEEALRSDPAAAAELLGTAREANAQVLADLRGLVRGIYPPVLADRGLDGAVRALAASTPFEIELDLDPTDGLGPALSAAIYFAIAEALANAFKHGSATRATVSVAVGRATVTAVVTDDGTGGAAIEPGGGLAGMVRRLGAHDGRVGIDSPRGGPTVITLEVPCGS